MPRTPFVWWAPVAIVMLVLYQLAMLTSAQPLPDVRTVLSATSVPVPAVPLSAALQACTAHSAAGDESGYRRCLDTRVATVRAALAGVEASSPLPTAPPSLGVHTACLKFGRACPIEYVAFLESQLPASATLTDEARAVDDAAPVSSPTRGPTAAEIRQDSAMPFAFNASWSYANWSRLVNLHAHVEVLQRKLQTRDGASSPLPAASDVLSPARVREWQRALSTSSSSSSSSSPSAVATARPALKRLWRCWLRDTLPAHIARAAVSSWQCILWDSTDDAGWAARLWGPGRLALRVCLAAFQALLWPQWSWMWWGRRLLLLIQVRYLIDAFAGEPLADEVVKDTLEAAHLSAPPPTMPQEPVPPTSPITTLTVCATTPEAIPSPTRVRDAATAAASAAKAEVDMEELVRYYAMVDHQLEQHVPLVFVKLRRVLCICLLCQFALLMGSFVEEWLLWIQGSDTPSAPRRPPGGWLSVASLLTRATSWASPWRAVQQTVSASTGVTSLLWLLAPVLVGLPTLVLAAKGLMEANRLLDELHARTLRDLAAILRPA